ncbi:MAG: hypothetical protein WB422_07940 [Pseudolabrys sp.]
MGAAVLGLAASPLDLGAFTATAGTDRMNLLAGDHPSAFVASAGLEVLVAGLNARDVFVGFDSLDAFVFLETVAALDILNLFVRLDTLNAFALEPLRALDTLDRFAALDTLNVFAGLISKLLLQLHVFELHVAVMRGVEFPVLELATAAEIDLVEFAVEHGVGLNCREPAVSPIVVVPQRRTD